MFALKFFPYLLFFCFTFAEAKILSDSTATKPDGRPRSWRVRTATQIDEPLSTARPPVVTQGGNTNPNVFQDITPPVASVAVAQPVAVQRQIQNAVIAVPRAMPTAITPIVAPVVIQQQRIAPPIPQQQTIVPNVAVREKSAGELFPKTAPINRAIYNANQLQPIPVRLLPLKLQAEEFRQKFVTESNVNIANAPKAESRVGFFGVETLSADEQNALISQIGGLNRTILGIPIEKAKIEIRSTGLLTVYSDGVAVRRYLLQSTANLPKSAQVLIIGSKGVNRRYALNIGFRGVSQEDLQQMESNGIITQQERQLLRANANPAAFNQNQLVLVGTNVETTHRPNNNLLIDQMDLDEIYRILTVGTPVFFLP